VEAVEDTDCQVHLHDNSVMETLTNVTPYPDVTKYDVVVNEDLLPMLKDLYTVKLLPLYFPKKGKEGRSCLAFATGSDRALADVERS